MSQNFIGEITVYLRRNMIISMSPSDIGEIMVNEWNVYPHPEKEGIATIFIDKRDQVFYRKEGKSPKYTQSGDDACYAVIQRMKDSNNDSRDYIIDVTRNPMISEFEFFPLSLAEAEQCALSEDYLIFNNVPFNAVYTYVTDEEDVENIYSPEDIDKDQEYFLEDFDLQLIDQYEEKDLIAYRDLAVNLEEPDYVVAAAIRDHLKFKKGKQTKDK